MQPTNFDEVLAQILSKDPRYHREAYLFVRDGLDFAQKRIGKASKSQARHITGQELLEGLREFGLAQFGPLTLTVLQEWGVRCCEDFGELVFNMVEHGVLSKTESDSREDFQRGYSFEDAFKRPFLPLSRTSRENPPPIRTKESKT